MVSFEELEKLKKEDPERFEELFGTWMPSRRDFGKGVLGTLGAVAGLSYLSQGAEAYPLASQQDVLVRPDRIDFNKPIKTPAVDTENAYIKEFSGRVYDLSQFTGDTLNAKWDNMRANLETNVSYIVLIPPRPITANENAYNYSGEVWKVNGAMKIDDPENLGYIWLAEETRVSASSNISSFFHLSSTDKTEDVTIHGGKFFPGAYTVDDAILIEGGTRIKLEDISFGSGSGSITNCIKAKADNFPLGELRIKDCYNGGGHPRFIHIEGTNNNVENITIKRLESQGGDTIYIGGSVVHYFVEQIEASRDVVIELQTTGDGAPQWGHINFVEGGTGTTALLKVSDATSGAGIQVNRLTVENIYCNTLTDTMLDLDYLTWAKIHTLRGYKPTINIASACEDIELILPWNVNQANITDNGVRTLINGIGYNGSNDPATGGDWNGNGYEGVIVKWDDGAGTNYLSMYADGGWRQIATW